MNQVAEEIIGRREGIVRLVGTEQKYHTSPVYIAPKFESVTRTFTIGAKSYKGKEMTENEQKIVIAEGTPGGIRVSDCDSFQFKHLQRFDMSKEEDRFLLELALSDSTMVAPSKADVNNGVHRYYVEDKDKEASDKVSKSQLVFNAMEKLRSMSLQEMEDYGRLLGVWTKDISRSQLEAALYDMSLEKPSKILDVATNKDSKHKIFLRKLVSSGIVRVSNGKYMNGSELVGANEEYAIEFLRDSQNNALITQWSKMLKTGQDGDKANEKVD
jgi:hypothetical protein